MGHNYRLSEFAPSRFLDYPATDLGLNVKIALCLTIILSDRSIINVSCNSAQSTENEHIHHRQGIALHKGGGQLYEETVRIGLPYKSCSFGLIGLFTSRYPEALADSSFDNTGCMLVA